jgi:hypothetical protein
MNQSPPNRSFGHAGTKLLPVILATLCLNSCFPYYKEGNSTNTNIQTPACKVDFYVIRHYLKHAGPYQVIVNLTPAKELHIKPADIQVEMPGEKPNGIKNWDKAAMETYDRRRLSLLPDIDPAQPLDLKANQACKLIYSFKGPHHKQLTVRVHLHIEGESAMRDAVFERHARFQFFH